MPDTGRIKTITRLITLEEAARRLGIKPRTLLRYAKSGKIRAKLFVVDNGEHMMLVELEEMSGEKPRRENFAHLEGRGVSISQAAERYGIPFSTLQRWVQRGWIRIIREGGRGKPYELNEADIAYLAAIFKRIEGTRRGKRWKPKDL